MAIDIDNPQLGNINANINTNVNLNEGATIANAYNRLGNIIGNFGKEISTKYGYEYGKEQAISDIRNNLDKGADGAYNHVSMLTPYGQAYNQTMDKVVPAVLTAQYGSKLLQYANEIKSSNIPNNQKVEEYSKGVKPLIDDSVKQISPEYRDQVALMLTQQAGQDQRQLIQHTAAIDSQNQALASYDALNKNLILAEEAAKNKDISLANNYLSQNYNIIDAAVNTGIRSANEAKSLQQYSTRKILTDIALANGITSAVDLNNSLPEEKRLSGDEIGKIQETLDTAYKIQQKSIEMYQFKNHIDAEKEIAKAYDGQRFPSVPLNDEQQIKFNAGRDAYDVMQQLNDPNLTVEDQQQILLSPQVTSMSPKAQEIITNRIKKQNIYNEAYPVKAYNLQNVKGNDRLTFAVKKGFDPKNYPNLVSSSEVSEQVEKLSTQPFHAAKIHKDIVDNYENLTATMFKKIADVMGDEKARGMQFAVNTDDADSYLSKPLTTNLKYNKWLDSNSKNYIGNDYRDALGKLTPDSQEEIQGFINGVIGGSPATTVKDIINRNFEIYNGTLVKKGDADKLDSNELAKQLNLNNNQPRDFRYNPKNDTYVLYDKGKQTDTAITRTKLNNIKPDNLLQNYVNHYIRTYKQVYNTLANPTELENQ